MRSAQSSHLTPPPTWHRPQLLRPFTDKEAEAQRVHGALKRTCIFSFFYLPLDSGFVVAYPGES